ncbi:TM1802 family CRISPR-associated protein [Draconibacterium orientale]|uniref:TM1802 family CRISPR-associated protein n=1 Tax=Draconibacterium orientale TaxID=1168034 RepID=UPI002ABD814E|nr:TM1802 family CRISPR-associated protein [Draconibacterium orientale]
MQDKAIAAIGEWQLEENKDLEPVDLYIENMFSGKDYQMLLLVFEITNTEGELSCEYKGVDIEKVSSEKEDYRKYAYRKGSARGGDITFTTKISSPVNKKISGLKETTFKNILAHQKGKHVETDYFKLLKSVFIENEQNIIDEIDERFKNFTRDEIVSSGLSFKIIENSNEKYLRDFDLIKEVLILSGATTNFIHAGTESKSMNKISSVSNKSSTEIYGFAAPFKFSSPDKSGFISGFFNKKLHWRNYPISAEETLSLELGRKYIQQNLTGYFYGHEYMIVPHPIIKTSKDDLQRIINLLKTAFDEEKNAKKEKRRRAEDRILRLIANEKNYFNLDLLFYKEDKKTGAISINLMLEEVLPSRFRQLFIDGPERVNRNILFKNAITIKKELQDLSFSFQLIKGFFNEDFLEIVRKIFIGKKISQEYVYENIIGVIRKNHNTSKTSDGWVEPTNWTVKKAIMLIAYLQELEIINYNKKYKYMDVETNLKKESRFNLEGFNAFVNENSNFLDSDIKVGIFAVGVLVRFLYDIQSQSLNTSNPPFENKLRGYKLNPELLMNAYTEALDKIQKYQKNNYVYTELREIVNSKFILKTHDLNKMTNNELSFYFVAGLEMGKQFKREKKEN